MKFFIPIDDVRNGGSIWLHHIGDTLESLGYDVAYKKVYQNCEDADFVIIQSEWIEKPAYLTSKRAIILLGHFTSKVYPDSTKLRPNDIVLTQWKGQVVDDWEKRSGLKAHYFPHGYFKTPPIPYLPLFDAVWLGTPTPFRDLSWFDGLPITEKRSTLNEGVSDFYATSKICPNIHLSIQQGYVSEVEDSVAALPGYAVNERLFWICGAGGFQITDNGNIVRDFYDSDEVVVAWDKSDFIEKFQFYLNHPKERRRMARKAQERTLREHTYERRINDILLPLCQS